MGKFEECWGFWNKEIRLKGSCRSYTYGSTVGPKAGMFYKRTIAVLLIAAVAASVQGANAVQDPLLYRRDATQSENERVETTAASRDDLMDGITTNDTESDQTTISWMQFMEEDVANWNEENSFEVAQHIRLKRALDGEGSGSGSAIATTDVMTTGYFTTTTYMTETTAGATETNTDGSGFGETTTVSTDETTAVGTVTPTPYETSQSESTTEPVTSLPETSSSATVTSSSPQDVTETTKAGSEMSESTTEPVTSLPETSSSATVTSSSPQDVTETTEAGSGVEETTFSSSTATEYSSTESMTATNTAESTENPTSAESTVTNEVTEATNPSTATSSTPNDLTATTEEGSGMEEPTSTATVSEETTTSFPTEQPTESTTESATVTSTTAPESCDSVTCGDNEFCFVTDKVATCNCIPGYYKGPNSKNCSATKVFGGILHLNVSYDSRLDDSSNDFYKQTEYDTRAFLTACYSTEEWFVDVKILSFDEGSTLANYQVITKDQSNVSSSTVEAAFSNFIDDKAYFTNCTCEDTYCNNNPSSPLTVPLDSTVIAKESCNDAGTQIDLVCNTTTSDYCSTGTVCNATLDGNVACDCTGDLVPEVNSLATCVALVCSSSLGCNQPFGTCDRSTNAGKCVCMWGFQGTNCQIIWVFVLILCIAGVVLIAIIVAIAWWCRRRSRSKASYDSNPYSNAGAMSVSLERFHSMSDWDEKIGGVVPTSYKRISDSEAVDSAYERSSASGDFEQNPDARGVTLRNWRVSEIGSGDTGSNGSNDNENGERPVQLTTFQQVPDDSEVIGQTRI